MLAQQKRLEHSIPQFLYIDTPAERYQTFRASEFYTLMLLHLHAGLDSTLPFLHICKPAACLQIYRSLCIYTSTSTSTSRVHIYLHGENESTILFRNTNALSEISILLTKDRNRNLLECGRRSRHGVQYNVRILSIWLGSSRLRILPTK